MGVPNHTTPEAAQHTNRAGAWMRNPERFFFLICGAVDRCPCVRGVKSVEVGADPAEGSAKDKDGNFKDNCN